MRSQLARYVLILTALWLPLQAVAGLTMKLVAPAAEGAIQASAAMEQTCPYHRHTGGDQPAKLQLPHHNACDECGVCHLAGVAYMPVAEVVAAVLPASQSFQSLPAIERPSHIPEPPQYPPRRA